MLEPADSNPAASVANNNVDGKINVTSSQNNTIINVDKPKDVVLKHWRIQLFGESATAAASRYFFPICSQQK